MPLSAFKGSQLDLELLDAGSLQLVRLFRPTRQADGDWQPPEPRYRDKRVDAPPSARNRFAVLYTANTLPCVAAECRLLSADAQDRWTWRRDLAQQYQVVRYTAHAPALFLPIDHPNDRWLGLTGERSALGSYSTYQTLALELFERYGSVVHGMSWNSFHRNQLGRVYALWHHHKATVGLTIASAKPYVALVDDAQWQRFLAENPAAEAIDS